MNPRYSSLSFVSRRIRNVLAYDFNLKTFTIFKIITDSEYAQNLHYLGIINPAGQDTYLNQVQNACLIY